MKKRVLSLMLLIALVLSLCPAPAYADTYIETVSVMVTEPVVGAHPDYYPGTEVSPKAEYSVEVDWWDVTSGSDMHMDEPNNFEAGRFYMVSVKFQVEGEYYFADDAIGYVNGEYADFSGYPRTFFVRWTYPALNVISEIDVWVTEPVEGAYPDYNPVFLSSARYCRGDYSDTNFKNGVAWKDLTADNMLIPGQDTFIKDHEYAVYIYVKPLAGYSFDTTYMSSFINGAYENAWPIDENLAQVCGTFQAKEGGGWQNLNGKWYYYENGSVATGWKMISGKWYYFDNFGVLQLGWVRYAGKYYYFSRSTGALQTRWVIEGNNYYFFSPVDGTLQTGWVEIGTNWYYFSPSTGALVTGWFHYGGHWFYLSPNTGLMQTGWVKINGNYYYFNPSNGTLRVGWLKYAGYYFYLDPQTGIMVTGIREIDGKIYQFNQYGICVG